METDVEIRRVRADEWREVRDCRLEALQDPLAPLAFLETFEQASAEPDEFWQTRAAGGAEGSRVAQWVAIDDGAWVGTVAVIAFRAGEVDYYGAQVLEPRANLIGVYLRPAHRRQGILERLVATAAGWTAEQGFAELVLDVHELNARAIGAYMRCGFEITGERTVSEHGADLVMRLPVG
jgi:ribosomal protein S18 acetylase RimI-like enzyme